MASGAGLTVALLWAAACGDGSPDHQPSPAAIATAESVAREVKIDAPFSTTPVPEDDEREDTIVLDARVFGAGSTGVILAHMRPADQTSWFPFATELAATGDFTVLTFDFRGFGESTGEKEFDRVDTDLAAALAYMRDELDLEKVFLVGASMGGSAALVVAAREPVAGVVSISSPAVFQTVRALDIVAQIRAPKLFVTSEDDVPAQLSQEQFWAQAVEPKEQEIYPGDEHGTAIFAGPNGEALRRRLLAFLTSN